MAQTDVILILIYEHHCFSQIKKVINRYPRADIHIATIRPGLHLSNFKFTNLKWHFIEDYKSSLNNIEISQDGVTLINSFLTLFESELKIKCDISFFVLIQALVNVTSRILYPLVETIYLLRILSNIIKPTLIAYTKATAEFRIPADPVMQLLYPHALIYSTICNNFCKQNKYAILHVMKHGRFKLTAKNFIRNSLISVGKNLVVLLRASRSYNPPKFDKKINTKKTILILVRFRIEWQTVKNLYYELLESREYFPIIIQHSSLTHPTSLKALQQEGINYIGIHSHISPLKVCITLLRGKWQFWRNTRILRQKLSKLNFYDLGINVHELEMILDTQIIKEAIISSLYSTPELLLFMKEMSFWVNQFNAAGIITCDNYEQWSGVLEQVARINKISSFVLQNGTLRPIIYPNPVCGDVMWLHTNAYLSLLEMSKPKMGLLEVTGSPFYEDLYQIKENRIKSQEKEFTIAITTQAFILDKNGYNEKLIVDLCEVVSEFDISIVIKIHPAEKIKHYKKVIKKLKGRISISQTNDIKDILRISSILVSRTSTTLFTALLTGMPVISYLDNQLKNYVEQLDYLKTTATLKAYNREDLKRYIIAIKNNENNILERIHEARNIYITESACCYDASVNQKIIESINRNIKINGIN